MLTKSAVAKLRNPDAPASRGARSCANGSKAGNASGAADWPPGRVPRTLSLLLDHLYLHLIIADQTIDFNTALLSLQWLGGENQFGSGDRCLDRQPVMRYIEGVFVNSPSRGITILFGYSCWFRTKQLPINSGIEKTAAIAIVIVLISGLI